MLIGNIADFDINTNDVWSLPFMNYLQNGKRFAYICIDSPTMIAAAVHYLSEQENGSVVARSYAMGNIVVDEAKELELLRAIEQLDPTSESYFDQVMVNVRKFMPSSDEMTAIIKNSEPIKDITRLIPSHLLNEFLSLAADVKIGCDISNDVMPSLLHRIVIFNGKDVSDFQLAKYECLGILPLMKAFRREFGQQLL